VPVMRARYRSAGLTPHQRGWTDAGRGVKVFLKITPNATKDALVCPRMETAVNAAASARLFAKRHVAFYTTVFLLPLSATHGAIMSYMELGSCYL